MVTDGLLARFPVDAVYAMHNWPGLPVGTLVARDREMMAAFATFEIELTGKGAHGAMPHEGADTLLAASHIVTALQSIAARNVSPLRSSVVSVTQVHGGDAWNVLPETAVIRGTTRWFDPEVGDLLEARMKAIVSAVATGFDCSADLRYQRRYPSTLNIPENAALVRKRGSRSWIPTPAWRQRTSPSCWNTCRGAISGWGRRRKVIILAFIHPGSTSTTPFLVRRQRSGSGWLRLN